MKPWCFLFLVLTLTSPALAAETGDEKEQINKSPQQEKEKKNSGQLPQKQKRPPVNNTFHPTERIGADTVISFPADI
jgi:nitrate reductase cytochrome c-type subunit